MVARGWRSELRRAALSLSLAALADWLTGGFPLLVCLAALALLGYWALRLQRLSDWLDAVPEEPPPLAGGFWGELMASIHRLRREDRDALARLRTEVRYLRDSLAALREAAVLIDPEGRIEWSNSAAERLLGLQYPRDRGQAVGDLLRIPGFHRYLEAADFSEPLSLDAPLEPARKLLLEVTRFGRGSLLLLGRDVTREERIGAMRRDFVANVSHELRTPLTVITGYLHTLLDHGLADDPGLGQPLSQMQEQAQRMETLLEDLLWLSRLESQGEQAERTAVDMGELLGEIRQHYADVYPGREIALRIDWQGPLEADYRQIYSAVSNLVQNALKYSEREVAVTWSKRGGELVLAVADRGPGIAAVHLPRLTERFYRVDKSRSAETGGTGLGLAIVKHVLAARGARLEVASKPGRGSTFRCHFPMQ